MRTRIIWLNISKMFSIARMLPNYGRTVWCSVTKHLGLRSSELFVHLNKDDVQFKTKEDGSEYVTLKATS